MTKGNETGQDRTDVELFKDSQVTSRSTLKLVKKRPTTHNTLDMTG